MHPSHSLPRPSRIHRPTAAVARLLAAALLLSNLGGCAWLKSTFGGGTGSGGGTNRDCTACLDSCERTGDPGCKQGCAGVCRGQ